MNAIPYEAFLASKAPRAIERGLSAVPTLSSSLFPFQRHCVETMLRVGSGGLFLDTGLGKTLCELEWSEHARNASNGKALILAPLAVARQIERERPRSPAVVRRCLGRVHPWHGGAQC